MRHERQIALLKRYLEFRTGALPDHVPRSIELWRALPISVERTLISTSLYAPEPPRTESARRHWKKNLDLLLHVTETEDFPMMADIQHGLASGAVKELIYGKLEPALNHYHQSLNHLLAFSNSDGN